MSDYSDILAALVALPAQCRYHGTDLERAGEPWGVDFCCDTGRPALLRRRALVALGRRAGSADRAELEAGQHD